MFLAAFRFFGFFGDNHPLDNNRFVRKVQLTQHFDEAIVTEAIAPHKNGQIRYLASWWLARCELDIIIPEGEIVLIVGRSNSTTFLVQPLPRVEPS
ncbi:NfeD family protein [Spirulina sp. 06S082]|uniref:NfeD family protein n=1 Tax=Spirulina sp. 06S082 TaxID=3110248 RepID=UPI002B1E9FEC|nr:NfeD family protein [Spirulina sp. 06S082]MEA5471414.1 NfeD family protein [Spirulina sp. 06S082]